MTGAIAIFIKANKRTLKQYKLHFPICVSILSNSHNDFIMTFANV